MNSKITIVLVDDEESVRQSTQQMLELAGFNVSSHKSAKSAQKVLSKDLYGILLTDIKMPEMDGIELLHYSQTVDAQLPVILISGHADIATAVSAIRQGAYDVIEKPFSNTHLIERIEKALEKRRLTMENRQLREELDTQTHIGPRIMGNSPAIKNIRKIIHQVANSNADILINGETGTGKELVARSLHQQSNRAKHNFVAINCGSIPENLLDSELFGHEAGAFTDAKQRRIGKFEYANGGTLFLDEIESMSLQTQAPLLRVLQERKIERLGANELIDIDIRVLAASKVDLKSAAESKEFREDLYYRLNVITIDLPPLRERIEDIPLLFQHFVHVSSARCEAEVPPLNTQTLQVLLEHDWPGNIRELRNMAERYVILGENHQFNLATLMDADNAQTGLTLPQQVACFEKTIIEQTLNKHNRDLKKVMNSLGLPRKTLSDKLSKYKLNRQ